MSRNNKNNFTSFSLDAISALTGGPHKRFVKQRFSKTRIPFCLANIFNTIAYAQESLYITVNYLFSVTRSFVSVSVNSLLFPIIVRFRMMIAGAKMAP